MTYQNIVPAIFLARPNRFIAQVELDGQTVAVHVKNTGRCRELLIPGCRVWLEGNANPSRKTKFDLVAVDKAGLLINMDAQAPNKVFSQWAMAGRFVDGLTLLRPETTWGSSRFDFYWEAGRRRGFAEIKGVTLEEDGLALFPDAPTQRGVKHLRELVAAGKRAMRRRCASYSKWAECALSPPTTEPIPNLDKPSGRRRRPGCACWR